MSDNLADLYRSIPRPVITGRNGDWQLGDTCDDDCPSDPHFHVNGGPPRCLFPDAEGRHPQWCNAEHMKMTVIGDTIRTDVDAVMATGSSTVEDWYLDQEPADYPDRERLKGN